MIEFCLIFREFFNKTKNNIFSSIKYLVLFLVSFSKNFTLASDIFAPKNWQVNLQDAASPLMSQLHEFHNILLYVCFGISSFVLILILYVIWRFRASKNPIANKFSHNIILEIGWTSAAIIILIIIAIPSFRILKFADKIPSADMIVKVVGSRWYWTYSYPDFGNIEYDSNVIPDDQLLPSQYRLFDVDNRLVVPENTVIKFLITASDVIHSFAVPALGIKTDAIPGRTNETWTKIIKKGVYYGQCSELCGAGHGFMPIAIEVVDKETFIEWTKNAQKKFSFDRRNGDKKNSLVVHNE